MLLTVLRSLSCWSQGSAAGSKSAASIAQMTGRAARAVAGESAVDMWRLGLELLLHLQAPLDGFVDALVDSAGDQLPAAAEVAGALSLTSAATLSRRLIMRRAPAGRMAHDSLQYTLWLACLSLQLLCLMGGDLIMVTFQGMDLGAVAAEAVMVVHARGGLREARSMYRRLLDSLACSLPLLLHVLRLELSLAPADRLPADQLRPLFEVIFNKTMARHMPCPLPASS